ncbi:MAG TPA: hypothetical protein VLG38_07770 [Gammaproteobacteria bacterium]|nr:hypothetical protein [Gammaproteobacteria bacterium]
MHDNLAVSAAGTPTSVSLAGSCMQILHRKIMASLQYLDSQRGSAGFKVFVMHDMYYEVCKALGLNQDFEHDKIVSYRGTQPQAAQNYDGQTADLMLLNFHGNVNRRKRGFGGHHVMSIIQNQFNIRAKNDDSRQLIVILDATMTDLSGEHIRRLLVSFQAQIESGKLAIILITSLNKYCQIGFDRFPSGISADHYAKIVTFVELENANICRRANLLLAKF